MNQNSTLEFNASKPEERVIFYYEGYFMQSIIDASSDALRHRVEHCADAKARRRLVAAFIELGQNIVHYSADRLTGEHVTEGEIRFGALKIEQNGERFKISCSNPVTLAGQERLQSKLEVLVKMSLEEVKQSYREALRAEGDAESKGGGIGLLTLARESVEPLTYSFSEMPGRPERKLFNLTVTV